jgi:acetoacetate decarboxylase
MKENLKGFCYPLTPKGVSSLVGELPWYYAAEYLTVLYRTDPDAIAEFLPDPIKPGPNPGLAYVAFSKWWSLWENQRDMAFTNPERTQYKEAAIWTGCSYEGHPGQICLLIWVDNDFSMARGWFMGFPKKMGQIHITEYNPLNPLMQPVGEGTRFKGFVCSHGERLIEGTMRARNRIPREELPEPLGLPIFHIRHFPSICPGCPDSVAELVKLGAEDVRYSEEIWQGEGSLNFIPSEIEEHSALKPVEILGAYKYASGYTFPGADVLYSWV